MHTTDMNAPPLGPHLITLVHPVMGPVTHADPTNEASDEIPRLTRLFREDSTQEHHMNGLTSLLGLLRADDPADESALQYGPITRQAAQNDFAADMVVVQLQCTSLLARVEALEAENTRAARTPDPGGNHWERDCHKHNKQRSREKQGARQYKMERNI